MQPKEEEEDEDCGLGDDDHEKDVESKQEEKVQESLEPDMSHRLDDDEQMNVSRLLPCWSRVLCKNMSSTAVAASDDVSHVHVSLDHDAEEIETSSDKQFEEDMQQTVLLEKEVFFS
jgi:hypothetical protein